MLCKPKSKAESRYLYRLAPTMLVYVLCLLLVQRIFHHHHPSGWVTYGLAVLPALPLVGSLVIVGLYIAEESDEFQRSIVIQAMLWGLGGALSVGTTWGFLEEFANAPHVSIFYVYAFFWIFMGLAQPFVRRRYR